MLSAFNYQTKLTQRRAVMENLIKTSTNREKPGTSRLIVAGHHGTNHGTVRVKVFRESSFNMTRAGGDEDIEGGL